MGLVIKVQGSTPEILEEDSGADWLHVSDRVLNPEEFMT